ncbi:hypothetical protein ACP275_12G021600 [Erythranthe tilingii]
MDIKLVVYATEEYVNKLQYALDTFTSDLINQFGPDAIPTMSTPPPPGAVKPRKPLPRRAAPIPIRLPEGIPREVVEEMVDRIEELDFQHQQQLAQIGLITKVIQYASWMWDQYYNSPDSPVYEYLLELSHLIKPYLDRKGNAFDSFAKNWNHLTTKLGTQSQQLPADDDDDSIPATPFENWRLTALMLQQLLSTETP